MLQAKVKKDTLHTHKLTDTYTSLPNVEAKRIPKLHKLCGERYVDLLFHLPSGVMDRSQTPTIAEAITGETATLKVKVIKHSPKPYPKHRKPHTVLVEDESGQLQLVFFQSQPWLEKSMPAGATIMISGKVEGGTRGGLKKIIHPTLWGKNRELDDVAKLWPMYPLTAGVTHVQVKAAIDAALSLFTPQNFPTNTYSLSSSLPTFYEALQTVHNPQYENDLAPNSPARIRLACDEIFTHQLALLHARQTARLQPGISHGNNTEKQQKFLENLPFSLTGDQTAALEDINEDLSAPTPMLRLVQGDVGSGKTAVALLALLRVIENGCQGVLMAPTEILARQHYENACKWLEPLGITVALLVGSIPAAQKKRLKQHIAEGFANLIIGTHALVQDDVKFDRLGLAVIDEQHRFGVQERMKLAAHNHSGLAPDILVMTATPIPRTLALTFYGDMDSSIIREKPPGRTPVQTNVLPSSRLGDIAKSLQRILDKGEQVYWVCPLVEENEELDLTAATKRFDSLKKLYGEQVALLHGKMKPADKDAVMLDFKNGKFKILVATTVIEVGVDVPQATSIIIEGAERFGLSQLHQLRGRVGRSSLKSSCILLYQNQNPLTDTAVERLQAMKDSEDGFYLAEKDMELRGPGEILGTRQSGQETAQLADLIHHRDLIAPMRELAEETLKKPLNSQTRKSLAQLFQLFGKESASALLKAG